MTVPTRHRMAQPAHGGTGRCRRQQSGDNRKAGQDNFLYYRGRIRAGIHFGFNRHNIIAGHKMHKHPVQTILLNINRMLMAIGQSITKNGNIALQNAVPKWIFNKCLIRIEPSTDPMPR